jgi:hypothetical protein
MLQAGWSRFQFPIRSVDFSIDLIVLPAHSPGCGSGSNRYKCKESSWGKGRPARKSNEYELNV